MKALIFTPHGTAILKASEDGRELWCSDDDDDFAETNPNEFLGAVDADVIIDYLIDEGLVIEEEEIDVFEETLDDEVEADELDEDEDDA